MKPRENYELLATKKNKGEIVLYQPDEKLSLEVKLENETVWLTQQQMALLFGVKENNITYHIQGIYKIHELDPEATTQKIRVVRKEGDREVWRWIDFYNLDMIISVGYRVNSANATHFRRWATSILKEYLLKGYTLNQQLVALENRMDIRLLQHENLLHEHQEKIDFFVRTALPPVQGIFYDGQIFDAYAFVSELIRSAKSRITLIDNYVDESVLLLLSKQTEGVSARVITRKVSRTLQLDIEKFNRQYAPISVVESSRFHDRFLIIDNDVYHIGASLKDLGKKLFAFSKMDVPVEWLEP